MPDPSTLRAQAADLRAVARAVREQGHALDDDLRALRARYPLPSVALWQGPHATRYLDQLESAQATLEQLARDADGYADDCEDEARRRDRQADEIEAQRQGGG